MSKHKEIYFKAFGYTPGDFAACECCGAAGTEAHAIIPDGMGGRPNKSTHRIENLIWVCRRCHIEKGESKQWKASLFKMHRIRLEENGVPYDREWTQEQIERFETWSETNNFVPRDQGGSNSNTFRM